MSTLWRPVRYYRRPPVQPKDFWRPMRWAFYLLCGLLAIEMLAIWAFGQALLDYITGGLS